MAGGSCKAKAEQFDRHFWAPCAAEASLRCVGDVCTPPRLECAAEESVEAVVERIRNASPECLDAWKEQNFDSVKMWLRGGGFPEIPPFPAASDPIAPDMDESLSAMPPRCTSLFDSLGLDGTAGARDTSPLITLQHSVPQVKLASRPSEACTKPVKLAAISLACPYGPQGVPLCRSSLGWRPSLLTIPEDGIANFGSAARMSVQATPERGAVVADATSPPCQGSSQKSSSNKTRVFSSI